MSTPSADPIEKTVFRKTNAHSGRRIAVTPANSSMRHLSYGRIILNPARPSVSFSNEQQETGLICLAGNGAVKSAGHEHNLDRFDAIYIPRGSEIEVSTKTAVDFSEISSPVEGKYPLQVIRYADVAKDAGLKFVTGSPTSKREVNLLIASNVKA